MKIEFATPVTSMYIFTDAEVARDLEQKCRWSVRNSELYYPKYSRSRWTRLKEYFAPILCR